MAPSLQLWPPFWIQALKLQPSASGLTLQEGNGSWISLNPWLHLLFGRCFNTILSWEHGTEHHAMSLGIPLAFGLTCDLEGPG